MARDLVCFSHLRWDFVYQRPNHLMARAARDRRVFFVEEPVEAAGSVPRMRTIVREGVTVVTPVLPATAGDDAARQAMLARLMSGLFGARRIVRPVLWYVTPMAVPWSSHLASELTVYDSMDYLAGFRDAPRTLLELEAELIARADLVFCGGARLHGRMVGRHRDSHCFPSSVDLDHFRRARTGLSEPEDQAPIGRPRIGYAGVIDERIDVSLIDGVARARPDWAIVLVGPVAKIDPGDVPVRPNIHRLGTKSYAELPSYLAGWDVGWMPFARNDSTRFISPTKTPEYLAAALPVVSTSIHDVVDPYGRAGFVAIADDVDATVAAVDHALRGNTTDQAGIDAFLADRSWDRTWASMADLIDSRIAERPAPESPARRTAIPTGARSRRQRDMTQPAATVPPAAGAAVGVLGGRSDAASVAAAQPLDLD